MVIDDSRKQVLKRFHGSMEDNNNIMKEVSLTSRSTSPPSHDIIILFMLCRGGCSNSQPNPIFVYCKRDIFPKLPLTRAHVNRLRSLLMAISFHLQSLLENHQSHLPPKGAKGEEVNKMTRFRNLRFPVNNFLFQIVQKQFVKFNVTYQYITKQCNLMRQQLSLSPSLKG